MTNVADTGTPSAKPKPILPPGLEPFAVTIAQGSALMGNKSHSEIYECAGRGELS
jgi:hypothetical protein